jgi:hypothetical protein
MKKKLLSLEELQKSWWWKREEIRRDGVPGVDWPKTEEAARNYELACRSVRKKTLPSTYGRERPATYLELGREEKTIVANLWVNWPKNPYRIIGNRNQFQETGWTPAYENQYRQWNLRLTDKKLMDEFIREIRNLRAIQKIPTPRRNKGENHRGVSWALVEILDLQQNRIEKLNDIERHQASKAKKLAEKYLDEYTHALDEFLAGIRADLDMEYTNAEEEVENPYTDKTSF